jgi:polysaccharide chain length determinant protein (PEP-CTERM system associated)
MNGERGGPQDDAVIRPAELVRLAEIPLRRPLALLLPWLAITAAALSASFVLPKRYLSSTLILVESEKVPAAVGQRIAITTEGSTRRLVTIRQEILSRTRLERVIEETGVYADRVGRAPLSALIEKMRSGIDISTRGDDAFTIGFTHTEPAKAQAVANRLATLFIEETVRNREDAAKGALSFIEAQLESARQELELKEEALRHYKEQRMGSLPEQTSANLATLQRLQLEEASLSDSLRAARDRLARLEADFSAGSRSGAGDKTSPLAELERLRAELTALRTRYTEEHPDVRTLANRLARLEQELSTFRESTDPAAHALRSQIDQARLEIDTIVAKRRDLAERIAAFQARVEQAPRTEQELAMLTRDHFRLRENYQELLKKKLDAQMTERLEERWKGERFRVLDPAFLPETPVFPKRSLFLLGGLVGGLLVGLGLCLILEFMDTSIKDEEGLAELLPLPVLATFPHVTAADLPASGARPGRRGSPFGGVLNEWRR